MKAPDRVGRVDASSRPDDGLFGQLVARFGPVEWFLLVAFVVLAAAVASGHGVQAIDDWALRTLPSAKAPGGPHPLAHASYRLVNVASPETSIFVTLGVAGVWSWSRRDLEPLLRIAPPVVIGGALVLALKALLRRTGPPASDPVRLFGYFPSGHTATALLCAGALALAVAEGRPRRRAPLLAAAGAWTLMMAAALLYQRFHWSSDVVGAGLLGLLVLRVTRPGLRWPNPMRLPGLGAARPLRPVRPSSDGAS